MLELKVGRGVGKGNEGEKTYLNGGVKMENSNEKIDILNRERFINRVLELTYKISENEGNMTFAINGEWGCGKTFVLEKIQEKLEKNKNFLVIPYNCWKYDYYEEPLIAIVAALIDFCESKKVIDKETIIALKRIIVTLIEVAVPTTAAAIIDYRAGVIAAVINVFVAAWGRIKNFLNKTKDDIENAHKYDNYYNFNKVLSELQEQLRKLSKEHTIVFFVDELDRCLPEYTVKVLERLHHVSEDVPNMITILALDKKRLKHTVGSIFGYRSADNYLKKFIRCELSLDNGIQNSQKFFDKFSKFYDKFDASKYQGLDENKTEQFLKIVFQSIDIRSQELIIEKASIVHDLSFGTEKPDLTVMYMELFYSVLWYHYKTKSIFDNNHAVSKGEFIFEKYKDIPKHFNDSWGFIPTAYINPQDSRRINIDSSDILLIVFYYWFHVRNTRLRPDIPTNELWPEVKTEKSQIFGENLKKLEDFLDSLALID